MSNLTQSIVSAVNEGFEIRFRPCINKVNIEVIVIKDKRNSQCLVLTGDIDLLHVPEDSFTGVIEKSIGYLKSGEIDG